MKGLKVGDRVERYCAFCGNEHLFICMRFDLEGIPQGRSTHRCPGLQKKTEKLFDSGFEETDYVEQCLDVDYPPSGKRTFVGPDLYIFEPHV